MHLCNKLSYTYNISLFFNASQILVRRMLKIVIKKRYLVNIC